MSAGDAGRICLCRRWRLVSAGDAQCSSAVFGGVCVLGAVNCGSLGHLW